MQNPSDKEPLPVVTDDNGVAKPEIIRTAEMPA
jgi:hypothetical protein